MANEWHWGGVSLARSGEKLPETERTCWRAWPRLAVCLLSAPWRRENREPQRPAACRRYRPGCRSYPAGRRARRAGRQRGGRGGWAAWARYFGADRGFPPGTVRCDSLGRRYARRRGGLGELL